MRFGLSPDQSDKDGGTHMLHPAISWGLGGLFAAVFAIAVMAILKGDYLARGHALSAQENNTITICTITAALTFLICWRLQTYAAARNVIIRAAYGLAMLIIVFGAVGGVLVIVHNYVSYAPEFEAGKGLLFKGYYWESVSGFYSLALFMLSALSPSLLALFAAGGLTLALAGPRRKVR